MKKTTKKMAAGGMTQQGQMAAQVAGMTKAPKQGGAAGKPMTSNMTKVARQAVSFAKPMTGGMTQAPRQAMAKGGAVKKMAKGGMAKGKC